MVIITIDGPAGAGKSTVAKQLAQALGFQYLDTGAMYRAMALAAMQAGINLHDPQLLWETCRQANLEFSLDKITLDGRDISEAIRSPEVTSQVKPVADHPDIRELLVEKQRDLAASHDVVCEGRDQGTVAFPSADCKIFLTASSKERAWRRQQELSQKGIDYDLNELQSEQDQRDQQDYARPIGALKKADDAIEFCSDGLTIAEVVEKLKSIVEAVKLEST